MAGDWIKMRANLAGDPAVKAMARALKMDPFSVVGRLHEFWSWADQHTDSGLLPVSVLEDVDDVVDRRGFAAEMVRVGWLVDLGVDGLEIPKWDRHNGESAKKRCMDQERQRVHRAKKASRESHVEIMELSQINRDAVTSLSHAESDQRREEKSITPIVPDGDGEVKPDRDHDLLVRAKGLFTRGPVRLPIRLDSSQLRAWKKNKGAVADTTPEEWALLEEAYAQTDGVAATYRRKDLAQLLNNWSSEIERALDWKKRAGAAWRISPQKKEGTGNGPEGWREALAALYPDAAAVTVFGLLSPDVRVEIEDYLAAGNEEVRP